MKIKTQNSEKALLKILIREKVCVGNPINVTDSTQYSFLLGQREKIYTLLNPKLLLRNLKAFFHFLPTNEMRTKKEFMAKLSTLSFPVLTNQKSADHFCKRTCDGSHHVLKRVL